MNADRIQTAIEASKAHQLMGLTMDLLAGELQRIEQILTGKPYFDYVSQKWITD